MPTLCDPLSHEMDIDSYDIHEWEGQCQKCGADLTYKWGYDQDQMNKSNIYFNSYTGEKYHNYDIGTMSDYRINSIFAVLSDVDNDHELLKGVFIIPYTSVTIISLKGGVQTTTTDIFNPTYDKLKSSSNTYGNHTGPVFDFKGWEKLVVNDSWLKTNYSGVWNAINKRYI
tara:strand:- start:879 stop:1391 length:513 start_codon:yes stop_codon:yes gene_type:complete